MTATITVETPLDAIPTPESVAPLFRPIKVGPYDLKTRVVYAPLTRCRAVRAVPVPESIEYYEQRANPGQLMLTEATGVYKCDTGYGYPNTPGIFSQEQMDAWKPIVEAVHNKGAVFFAQIWHTGRANHPTYLFGEQPVSSTDKPITDEKVFHPETFEQMDYPAPRPLDASEIPSYVEMFRQGARNAMDVGFDGVEIHATNGYLIDQFLCDGINDRTDEYGGSIENRCRFCLEIVKAVTEEVGSDRVGIRLGPFTGFLNAFDSQPYDLYNYLVDQLNTYNLAYMHFIEPRVKGNDDHEGEIVNTCKPFKERCKTVVIAAGGYIDRSGKENEGPSTIADGTNDMVAYGRWALANPDFLKRLKLEAPLNKYDRPTFYALGRKGYTDYPYLQDTEHGKDYFVQ